MEAAAQAVCWRCRLLCCLLQAPFSDRRIPCSPPAAVPHSPTNHPTGTSGYTPLIYAAREGHADVVELLLQLGADANAATKSGGACALHRAAYMGHLQVVSLLLAAGAEPMQQDADGQTAL